MGFLFFMHDKKDIYKVLKSSQETPGCRSQIQKRFKPFWMQWSTFLHFTLSYSMFYRADWNTDIEGDKQHYKVMALFNGKNWEHESTENPQKNEAVKGASSGEWGN